MPKTKVSGEQLALFTICVGPLDEEQRIDPASLYETEVFELAQLHMMLPNDPFRMGHVLPEEAKMIGGRCLVCRRLWQTRTVGLTQSQRAIRAAECWPLVGGPPNPHGGRPKKRKPGSENAALTGGENPLFGYPVTHGLMAARWGVSEAYVKRATVLVTRAPGQANAVRRGAVNLTEAWEDLLSQEGGTAN